MAELIRSRLLEMAFLTLERLAFSIGIVKPSTVITYDPLDTFESLRNFSDGCVRAVRGWFSPCLPSEQRLPLPDRSETAPAALCLMPQLSFVT